MLGLAYPQAVGVHALELHEVACQLPLARLVKVAVQGLVAGLALACHAVGQKRHDTVLDLRKEGVVEGAAGALLVLVEPHVVGVDARLHRAGHALLGRHQLVDVGLKRRPVVCRLGLVPHVVCLDREAREGRLLVQGHVDQRGSVAPEHFDLGCLGRIELVGRGVKALQHLADLGRAQGLDALFLKQSDGLAPLGQGVGRVDYLAQRADLVDGVAVREERLLKPVERLEVLVDGGRGRRCTIYLQQLDILSIFHGSSPYLARGRGEKGPQLRSREAVLLPV